MYRLYPVKFIKALRNFQSTSTMLCIVSLTFNINFLVNIFNNNEISNQLM